MGAPSATEASPGGQSRREEGQRVSVLQELSRAKAAALSERGRAEEELMKAKNQVRLEEVRPRPGKGRPCSRCPLEAGPGLQREMGSGVRGGGRRGDGSSRVQAGSSWNGPLLH